TRGGRNRARRSAGNRAGPRLPRCAGLPLRPTSAGRRRDAGAHGRRGRVQRRLDLDLDRLELVLELGKFLAAGHQADELLAVVLRLLERAEALAAVQD